MRAADRRRSGGALALLALVAVAPGAALAQEEKYAVPSGSHVSVAVARHVWEGEIRSYGPDSMTLRVHGRRAPVAIAHDDIRGLALRTSKSSVARHAWLGAAWGAGLGAVLGFAIYDPGARSSRGVQTLAGAGAFACLGFEFGLMAPSGEEWRELPIDGIRVVPPAAARHDAQVAVTLRF